jgi:hypothetical protein
MSMERLARSLQPELERAGWTLTLGSIAAVLEALEYQRQAKDADDELAARVIRLADERGDFVRGEDGSTYYWPLSDGNHGAISAWALHVLAREMEKRDKGWDAVVRGDPSIDGRGCIQVWKWEDAPEEWKKLHVRDGDEDWLALVPKKFVDGNEAEIWWMRWYPERVKRYAEAAPLGFEIWVGVHA